MKKTLSLVLAVVLLCGCLFTLASCSMPLSGKYKNDLTNVTYEFKGSNFTRTAPLIAGIAHTSSGTYKITKEGDVEYITFTYSSGEDEDKKDDGVKLELTRGTEGDVKYIKFGSLKYEKVD